MSKSSDITDQQIRARLCGDPPPGDYLDVGPMPLRVPSQLGSPPLTVSQVRTALDVLRIQGKDSADRIDKAIICALAKQLYRVGSGDLS